MLRNNHVLFLVSLLSILVCGIPGRALALNIENVRFGAHAQDKIRLVLDMSAEAEFRVFTLADPYRMVVDLPGFEWKVGNISVPLHTHITDIRHGNLMPGISRIVFDVSRPVAIRAVFTLPENAGKPARLVIDYGPISTALFNANKGKSFGQLNPDSSTAATSVPAQAYIPQPPKAQKPLIILDAGHGGVDPGATGANGVHERVITLALARELKRQLLATGRYRVRMTREKDIFVKLADRVKFARAHQGDLFISLHADSLERRNVRGVSIYTLSEKASDAQTAKLAARENRADLVAGIDLSMEDEEVANILLDLAMRDTMNQSKFFANTLVATFRSQKLRTLESPHRSAGFAVLKAPDIPSVLVEAGFLSNRREADMLNNASYREKLARALRIGIDSYFTKIHENQRI